MKTICFIGIMLFSIEFNAQRMRIHVTEVIEVNGFDSTVIDLINNDSIAQLKRVNDAIYDLDLSEKIFKFYVKDNLDYEGGITFDQMGEYLQVNFIIDGYDIGMIINPNFFKEQVVWYSITGEYKEIFKFSKFEIQKSM